MTTVAPTQDDVYVALKAFLATIVPTGVVIIQGLPNRASMPAADPGFVAMTATLLQRLRTNVDAYDDPAQPPGPPFITGTVAAEMGAKLSVQLDFYGADSGDWAAMATTLLRSEYGVEQLAPDCAPLYAEDARMAPLVDAERQYEQRWIVGAVLQYNPVTSTPIQFAATLDVELVNVDERYPP